MSIDFEPTVTTTVEDGYVYASIAYTGEQLDAMARELGKQVDAELFARLAMRHDYVPAAILDECQRENAKLRELVRVFYHCTTSGKCDYCPINGGGTVHLMPDTICDTLHDRMRELGIEVDDA